MPPRTYTNQVPRALSLPGEGPGNEVPSHVTLTNEGSMKKDQAKEWDFFYLWCNVDMYGHIPPNAVPSPQIGNEQVVFLTPTPGLAPSPNLYTASTPMAPPQMQFPAQPSPQVTGISPSPTYGCGPVIGVQVPMWTQVPQTSPTVIGHMMPYPTQPVQYQPCFIPPLQPANHGMYVNSQVQSYSIVPQQYIPLPTNRGCRPHVGMGQPSNVAPYMMHQDYMQVPNSGFPNPMGGAPPLQPPQTHTRPATFEMPSVQQAQFIAHCPKPPRHISAFVQKRAGLFNQQVCCEHSEANLSHIISSTEARGDVPKVPAKLEEQCEITIQSSQEEQSAELHKPKTDTVSSTCERAPTPAPQHQLEEAEDSEADVAHSPSETTLVPSPSSSDGVQTVCNSPFRPVLSDSEEEELTATEDDQIPTKDTGGPSKLTLACSSVERLEPEQPYDSPIIKETTKPSDQEQHNVCSKPRLLKKEELCSVQTKNPTVSGSAKIDRKTCTFSANQSQHHQRSIRSLIDTPVYNTSHSRVLCQLSQSSGSSARQCDGIRKRPLTTHFRQLFKPLPSNSKTEGKTS